MSDDFDVIVVGARAAGASVAMLLARRGHRVLLLDRARLPSEIRHGHLIHRQGPKLLQRWGLLDAVTKTGCPPLTSLTMNLADVPVTANDLELGGVAWAYAPRRGPFDQLLAAEAVASGAALRTGLSVHQLLVGPDGVCGARCRAAGATSSFDIRSKLTIGADGRHSIVARQVGANCRAYVQPLTCWFFSYWEGVPKTDVEVHVSKERCAIFAFPTNGGLYAVFVGWPIDSFAEIKSAPEECMLRVLDRVPSLGESVRAGRRAERIHGTCDVPNFIRSSAGPGWALLGDAGCSKDPFQALGMSDALRDAELLAEAAHCGLSGQRPLLAALHSYERRRDEATHADFQANIHAARFQEPGPALITLRQFLQSDPRAARRFFLQHIEAESPQRLPPLGLAGSR